MGDERLEAWLEEHHQDGWKPGPYGGKVIWRDKDGRFTRKSAEVTK